MIATLFSHVGSLATPVWILAAFGLATAVEIGVYLIVWSPRSAGR